MYTVKYSCPAAEGDVKHEYSFRAEKGLLSLLEELETHMGSHAKHGFLIEISQYLGLQGLANQRVNETLKQMPRSKENGNTIEIRTQADLEKLKGVLRQALGLRTQQSNSIMTFSGYDEKLQRSRQDTDILVAESVAELQKPRSKL